MSEDPCKISLALEVIGGKWKGAIVWWIKDEPRRFNELMRLLPGITQRTLTNQLKDLVRDGLLTRTQFEEVPPKVEYSATELCRTLVPLLDQLRDWGAEHRDKVEQSRSAQ